MQEDIVMGFKIRYRLEGTDALSSRAAKKLVKNLESLAKSIGCFDMRTFFNQQDPMYPGFVFFTQSETGACVAAAADDPNARRIAVSPTHEYVMICEPGQGTESFCLGLASLPPTVRLSCGMWEYGPLLRVQGGETPWTYSSSCKTGLPDPNKFIAAHLRTIALLDAMAAAALQVRVCDDGGYWEHRNVDALLYSHMVYSVVPAADALRGEPIPFEPDRPVKYSKDVLKLVEMTGGTLQAPCVRIESKADLKSPFCNHECC
jgi:hypothetical protein